MQDDDRHPLGYATARTLTPRRGVALLPRLGLVVAAGSYAVACLNGLLNTGIDRPGVYFVSFALGAVGALLGFGSAVKQFVRHDPLAEAKPAAGCLFAILNLLAGAFLAHLAYLAYIKLAYRC